MVEIKVDQLSKRYGYQWIIRDFSQDFTTDEVYGIAGNNGSGKSTLIKMLSGYLTPTSGMLVHTINGNNIKKQDVYQYISLAAPYTDLINEFTLHEMFEFHCKFKKLRINIDYKAFESIIALKGQSQKTLQHFSSGMKQKIQLALALLSDTPVLLLDEPTSFLDQHAKRWFEDLFASSVSNRLVIIASNDGFDLSLCRQTITL